MYPSLVIFRHTLIKYPKIAEFSHLFILSTGEIRKMTDLSCDTN